MTVSASCLSRDVKDARTWINDTYRSLASRWCRGEAAPKFDYEKKKRRENHPPSYVISTAKSATACNCGVNIQWVCWFRHFFPPPIYFFVTVFFGPLGLSKQPGARTFSRDITSIATAIERSRLCASTGGDLRSQRYVSFYIPPFLPPTPALCARWERRPNRRNSF